MKISYFDSKDKKHQLSNMHSLWQKVDDKISRYMRGKRLLRPDETTELAGVIVSEITNFVASGTRGVSEDERRKVVFDILVQAFPNFLVGDKTADSLASAAIDTKKLPAGVYFAALSDTLTRFSDVISMDIAYCTMAGTEGSDIAEYSTSSLEKIDDMKETEKLFALLTKLEKLRTAIIMHIDRGTTTQNSSGGSKDGSKIAGLVTNLAKHVNSNWNSGKNIRNYLNSLSAQPSTIKGRVKKILRFVKEKGFSTELTEDDIDKVQDNTLKASNRKWAEHPKKYVINSTV